MKENSSNKKIYLYYYLVVMIGYILTLASSSVRPGVIASVLMLGIYIQSLWEVLKNKQSIGKAVKAFNSIDILICMYFVYNLLSGIWCVKFGMPVSVWAGEFSTGILPMIFFFAGRTIGDDARERFYVLFALAVYLVGTIGLILYIWGPQFYLDYLYDLSLISKADVPTMRVRMLSVIGSILMGYTSVAGMLASAHIMLKEKKNIVKGSILLFLGMLFAFLSNQRSAMVVAILVLLYVNYLVFFTYKLLDKKFFFMEIGVGAAGFAGLCIVYFRAIMKVYYRLVSLPGAVGQRSDQWIGAINNMSNLWLGNGLGANGHRANGITHHLIADGGIAKLFVEMGIIGMSIFVFMMILCFKHSARNFKLCCMEIGIVAITLLQSIGSNILEFQLATPIFWFAIGVIASKINVEQAGHKK